MKHAEHSRPTSKLLSLQYPVKQFFLQSKSPQNFPVAGDPSIHESSAGVHCRNPDCSVEEAPPSSSSSSPRSWKQNDQQKICLVYDAFLSEFPLCYGYWQKYAMHKARLCELSEAEEIYQRAIKVMPYSVDMWASYSTFGVLAYADPADIRRLFEKGISLVRKDYRCYILWDKYIEFEYIQKNWSHLAHIYVRTLQFPTRKLARYYDRFKSLINIWIEGVGHQDESKALADVITTQGQENVDECGYTEISKLISEFLDKKDNLSSSTAFKKYSSIGENFYHSSSKIDEDISLFEGRIKRNFFHVKPLDDSQLEAWHQYLDFMENQGDFDWIVKLYERCLIPCASYSEFWIRYVEFVDAKGGRELANHALIRAETVFLKKIPSFHHYCAMYKEHIGDVSGTRAIFLQNEQDLTSEFVDNVNREANMEKRMGNIGAAQLVYEKAIDLAKEKKNVQILPILYTNFARFMFKTTGKTDTATDMFIKGIQEVQCRSILQALIQFLIVHGGAGDITKLNFIVSNAIDPESEISRGLSTEDRECISRSYLEFLDFYGDIHEIRRAWGHHRKLFPYGTRCAFNHIDKSKGDNNGTLQLNSKIVCLSSISGSSVEQNIECVAQKDNANILSKVNTGCLPRQNGENEEANLMVTSDANFHDESMMERDELHVTINEPDDSSTDVAHLPIPTERQILHESSDAVLPHSLDNLTISCRDSETQQVRLNMHDSVYPQQVTATSCSENVLDEVKVSPTSCSGKLQDEVKADATETIKLESIDMTANSIVEEDFKEKETLLLPVAGPTSKDAQINPVCEMEVKLQTNTQHDLPVAVANPEKGSSTGHVDQTNYRRQASGDSTSKSPNRTRASKFQQCQDQAQYASAGYNSEFMAQAYPYQSHFMTNTQPLQASQQAYQNGFPAWSGQSTQMQTSPCTVSQPNIQTAQSQTDVYQQYGYFPNSQGLASHMWYYYQQQQQQQNQQSNFTDPTYQMHPQQQPAEGNQMFLQPQQKQHQQNDNQMELQQNAPSSEKIPNQMHHHQQHSSQSQQQGEQQQQLAQQQQQQLLYMQQQQLYLQHQQQLYLQQQQLYLQQQQHHHYQQQHQEQHPQKKQEQQPSPPQQHHPEGQRGQENKLSQQQQQQLCQQQQHIFQVNLHQKKHISGSEVQTSSSDVHFQEAKLHDVEQSACSRSSTPATSSRKAMKLSEQYP